MKQTPPCIIGIAGPSCSGKTSVASNLSLIIPGTPPILSFDSYYRDFSPIAIPERDKINFDLPESLEHELIIKHIHALSQNKPVEKPIYDYRTHLRVGTIPISPSGNFIIIEGLYTFYWKEIRNKLGLKIFINLDDNTAFERRIERDVQERGSNREYVIAQYNTMVRPMFKRFILPTMQYADLILDGTKPVEESVRIVMAVLRKTGRYKE